jgi:hypothetical protein
MDGRMLSDTNADLAADCDRVLIIAPIGSQGGGAGLVAQRPVLREVAQLRADGAQVELIVPDARADTGPGARHRVPPVECGRRRRQPSDRPAL